MSKEDPDGTNDCTYTYNKDVVVIADLDDLVGIKLETCMNDIGTEYTCKNWLDFRRNCKNPAYKKKFSGDTPTDTEFCVEYDIAPSCLNDCNANACKALAA